MSEVRQADVERGSAASDRSGARPIRLFGDVLCAVDGSPGGFVAVEQAAALTGSGGHITLLAVTSFRSAGASRSPAMAPGAVKELLDEAARIAADAGVATTVEVDPAAPPADVILQWAAAHELLAMGAPTTPWLGGIVGGGPAAAAVGELLTPLLLARARPASDRSRKPIVVASDGLEGSDRLVELAAGLARSHGARLHLLHAARRGSRSRSRIERQGDSLRRSLAGDAEVTVELGGARSAIVDTAEQLDAAMIVMGSRRLHGPRTVGSISRHVAHRAGCSVLLIPPERLRA